ncbi:MAG: DUF1592 domain-containing protein, partial [Myxococcota bacterium]|nr:DUF1592 domain-containing protein [Myxococcota bacterium]
MLFLFACLTPQTCPSDETYFSEHTEPVLQTCLQCHASGGSAEGSQFRISHESPIEGLQAYVNEHGGEILLDKVQGKYAHGGGYLFGDQDPQYFVLHESISRIESPNTCEHETPTQCDPNQRYTSRAPLRRLNEVQYKNAVYNLLNVDIPSSLLPPTTKGKDFRTWASSNRISPSTIENLMLAAEYATAHTNWDALSECDLEETTCAQDLAKQLAEKAYRRPLLASDENQIFVFFESGLPSREALRLSVQLLLQSPEFLYIDGLAATEEVTFLSDYQIATRLSFFLTNAPPDAELWRAAKAGELQDRDAVYAQALRLAQSPEVYSTLTSFHYDWLDLYLLEGLFKDPTLYPNFGTHTIESMQRETDLFVTETLWLGR